MNMLRKAMTLVLIGSGLMIAACNTVRGAGSDVQSVANCTENAINNGNC
jgi:predicted small secreted protein